MRARLIIPLVALTAALALAAPAGAALPAPRLESPASGASLQAPPLMTWRAVSGAKAYDIQVAADRAFGSLVHTLRTRTQNTAASVTTTLADGAYFWRARAIDAKDKAGRWSPTRSFDKSWQTAPSLLSPAAGGTFAWPFDPLVLSWSPVPYATKYLVTIASDRSLASPLIQLNAGKPVETQGTTLAVPFGLSAGEYFWSVQPIDTDGHKGAPSEVRSFAWTWNAQATTRVLDGNDRPEVFDPVLNWNAVAGAAKYDVQVNTEAGFGPGSMFLSETVAGTSLAPLKALPNNNRYFWRIRAVDPDGRAGAWQTGPTFLKPFDDPDPAEPGDTSIENLHIRDHTSPAALPVGSTLSDAIVAWDPVPGAAEYELHFAPQVKPAADPATWFCDWGHVTTRKPTGYEALKVRTPVPYVSPVDDRQLITSPWPETYPLPGAHPHTGYGLVPGPYCLRVLASDGAGNDSVSTQLGSEQQAALVVDAPAPPPPPTCSLIGMTAGDYLEPAANAVLTRTPLFTWTAKPGARSYWIAVARDASFTDIVDIALVDRPMYVPHHNYADEESHLYWAVVASPMSDGSCSSATPATLAGRARTFSKVSQAPSPISPAQGADTPTQPVFRWASSEGAAAYHVQIARDSEFRDVIDDLTTASTSYAASATYPVDTQLFWRVRPEVCRNAGDDGCLGTTELRGSDVTDLRSFRRTLPVPVLDASNATSGETIPVLSWQPVSGAVSYDLHVDQADGTTRDFNVRAPRFSPILWYGTGVWTWRVRAVFPSLSATVKAQSAYSAPMSYVRRIAPPGDARVSFGRNRVAVAWGPDVAADKYRVEISESDSFTRLLDSVTTPNTNFAPTLGRREYQDGGKLFWRLAVVDAGHNVGAWKTGAFVLPRGLQVSVRGIVMRRRANQLTVTVRHRNQAMRGVTVRVSGAGAKGRRKTNAKGVATLRVRVRRGGRVKFTASKKGYRSGQATVVVLGS